jgi:hypothetical protein
LEFRSRIINAFPSLFGQADANENDDFSIETQFSNKWGWYISIDKLANGDVRRFDEITDLQLLKCLAKLDFESDKAKVEQAQWKKAKG